MAAFFLGLNGVVVKSHGGADAVGFASAVDMAIDMARADINARITADRSRITAESAGARAGGIMIRSPRHRLRRLSAVQHRHQ